MNIPQLPQTVTLPLEQVKPYDNNPRRIPQTAVDAVRQSLEEFGYHQPIVVDKQGVIIVGHTRREALRQMGVTEIPVYVADLTEEQAKEYRLVDNRTGEMSGWDYNQLIIELREWDQNLLDAYFPDINLDIVTGEDIAVTQKDIDEAVSDIASVPQNRDSLTTTVVCPSCLAEFQVNTASLPGLTRLDIAELTGGRVQ